MSNQVSNQESHLNTLRFSLPAELLSGVQSMRLLGNDLLFYVEDENAESVSQQLSDMGFQVVERVYKVHVSGPSAEFATHFGSYDHEVRGENVFTIVAKDKEQYDELIAMEVDGFRIRPFRQRYANVRTTEEEAPVQQNSRRQRVPDTEQNSWTQVSRPQRSSQGQGFSQGQRSNDRSGDRAQRSSQGQGSSQGQRSNDRSGDRAQRSSQGQGFSQGQRSNDRSGDRTQRSSQGQRSGDRSGDRSQRSSQGQRSNRGQQTNH
jgi:hypothetical protein